MTDKPYIWCEIVCHGCAVTVAGRFTTGTYTPLIAMKRRAEQRGWVWSKGQAARDWFCPKCKTQQVKS